MLCLRVFGVFVFAFVFVGRVVVYACAFVCCKDAFHITRVCRLHVRVAFVTWFVCLCLCACLASDCVCVCICMVQCSVSCYNCVLIALCFRVFGLFVIVCMLRSAFEIVCVCLCVLQGCVSYYTCA